MHHSRAILPATGGNRCNRHPLAGRLRDPETSILATPLAKSTKSNLQEGQIRETVVTFRSPRALNCETVLTLSLFWTPPLCGIREKCDTFLTFQCLTLWTHVFHDALASPTIESHVFYDTCASPTIGNHVFYDTFASATIGNHVFYDIFSSLWKLDFLKHRKKMGNFKMFLLFFGPLWAKTLTFSKNCTPLARYSRQPLQPPPLSR